MRSRRTLATIVFVASFASAADAQTANLFGQSYRVQRFDYFQSVRFADPRTVGATIGLEDAESALSIGGDHLLIASRQMDMTPDSSYRNFVVEVRLDTNASGAVSGVSYVRTVVVNDVLPPPQGLGDPFDLDPKGLALNPSASGIGAGGNLLVGGGHQFMRPYDLASGALLSAGIDCDPPNDDLEDIAWVPDTNGTTGRIATIDQSGPSRIEEFGASGGWLGGFGIGTASNPPAPSGFPKGLSFLPDASAFPIPFRGRGGVLLVSLDDSGPALQAFDRNGALVAYEPLSASVFAPGSQALDIEGVAADPATGRIVFVQQGSHGVNDFLWVLTPDCNGNGIPDALDIAHGASTDVNGDAIPDECQASGVAYCFGDGTGTPCPCGNASAFGANAGCANSLGSGGALVAIGSASVSFDTVLLEASGMPNSSALFFQGTSQTNSGLGATFGDGLRCAGGAVIRLGTKLNASGASRYPEVGDVRISVHGQVSAGVTREYQVWYRNAASFCTASTFNLTNGCEIAWQL
jgi:hypothetical protein